MTGDELARAALELVGTRWKLHGRDPRHGLDCVGVLAVAAASCGQRVALPNGYPLRSRRVPDPEDIVRQLSLEPASGPCLPGDVLLLRPGPCQYHLAIAVGQRCIVHAHCGLRQVVCGALPEGWPTLGHWRPHSSD
ncbi:hypothetical protein [Novosphingobium sp. KN65.2]|uniref:hypothetical protein n=1 Tax=Novosphingobium sp. KN65.2 TaxID=1478134 RepID=UPI0005E5121C|nr:hypothetical protein [Novosphingobium sp. KN65.2]CDO36840.1 conserved hypothetical protein [Novosphingobium sp. KN65.2]